LQVAHACALSRPLLGPTRIRVQRRWCSPAPSLARYASRQGEFPNEQFVRFQAGKIFRVLLDGGRQQAIVKSDGTFAIYDV
jgi:hypothetical protein